ncbi:hypothetical protein GCM10022289_31610 [Pedobacter jeongneungensis]|uniref:Natural product n=1 Tax=Pedobacter jeongneungensis TaxID=947309 RepID=A0ABP8BJ26_9SPHI
MSLTAKFNINHFEGIQNDLEYKLIGGFSLSFNSGNPDGDSEGGGANNCQGGNCTSSCGSGQNVQCNAVAHCGA